MCEDTSALHAEIDQLTGSYGRDAYLLYAMGLRLRTMDYGALKNDALLDGPDDKKVDFLYIDYDSDIATIVQSYYSEDWSGQEAPANKASDLNTALAWLLQSDLQSIPRGDVRAAAQELRDSLKDGEVARLEVFYVHNLPASINVERELGTVRRTAQTLLDGFAVGGEPAPECTVSEAGRETVTEWMEAQHQALAIRDTVTLHSAFKPQRVSTPEWDAVVASVAASEIVALKAQYGDRLFSPNIRDYLGSREAARNINREIERTAREEPDNFWVYNNGITLLSNAVHVNEETNEVVLTGVGIINGAQTTGSLAEAAGSASIQAAHVLARIIHCNSPDLVDSVIRYNNMQNPINPWELRNIDPVQRQLREDFARIDITYQLRRGVSRRRSTDLLFEKLAPYLSAFYGDPIAAHKNKAELFESESRYRNFFAVDTHVKNLLFIYRLGNAVYRTKGSLKERVANGTATEADLAKWQYFRFGAFAFVLVYVCAEVMGIWLEPQNREYRRRVTLVDEVLGSQEDSEALLARLADTLLGAVHNLLKNEADPYQTLKTQTGARRIADYVRTIVEQVNNMMPETYAEVTSKLELCP